MKNDFSNILSKINGSCWYIQEDALDMMLSILDKRLSGEVTDRDELRALVAAAELTHDRQHGDGAVMRGIGVIPLYGPIFPKANMMTEMSGASSLESFRNDFKAMMANDYVSTIVLDIDSPGGHADMIPETAAMIRQARSQKDVVAIANTAMNSAAYYLGSQASKVYASPSAQVGSIGTVMSHIDDSGAMALKGIKETYIHAGKYKAESHGPLSDETKAYLQSYVDQHYDMFVNDVSKGRETDRDDVIKNYGEGRVLTPSDGLKVGMIDGIASFDQVLGRLIESGGDIRGIESSSPVPVSASGSGFAVSASGTVSHSYDADKEHSEPGTGLGGEPTPREPPEEGDPAIVGGWRRDPPPIAYEEEEEAVNRQWLEDRATALGIEFSDEMADDDLAVAVAERMDGIVTPLASATADAQRSLDFARDYPEQAAQLQSALERDRQISAREFADSYRTFENDGSHGFSPLVREQLASAHLAIAERTFGHEQLNELVGSMASRTSIVPLGTVGSEREGEETTTVRPGASSKEIRTQFAELVRSAMTEHSLTQEAAIEHVSKQNPELASAYLAAK